MFQRLFGRERHANRAITDALYAQIVAAARQSVFYSHWNVPDTPLGRFEMLSLHMFLFQHRLRGEDGVGQEIAQVLIDEFFLDVDHSKMTAKFTRIPALSDVPFAVQMEPHLIVEFYSR